MYRIVVDTNVFISSLLTNGEARQFLNDIGKKYTLILSAEIIKEINEVIRRPKFKKDEERNRNAIHSLIFLSTIIETESDIKIVRDPDDNMFINAAKDGHADYIVTKDNDLLELIKYKGISIVTVREMLSIL